MGEAAGMSAVKPKILAVVPMKPLATAKSRLAPHLDAAQRSAVVRHLLRTVVSAAISCRQVTETWVVGGDEPIRTLALELGATWVRDSGRGLNRAVETAFRQWFEQDGDAALFLPGDLPLAQPKWMNRIVEASEGLSRVVLVPSRNGGTNAFLMPRDLAFRPLLGRRSFQRHLGEAARRNVPVACYASEALGLDVDTLDDLRLWMSLQPDAFAGEQGWTLVSVSPDKLFRERERSPRGR